MATAPLAVVTPLARKDRGAFFTPPAIASFLARWAVNSGGDTVLDPTCGEGVFLVAAGQVLREHGVAGTEEQRRLYGIDIHRPSLDAAAHALAENEQAAELVESDFFELPSPLDVFHGPIPAVDVVIGNPPFVRYQKHIGAARRASFQAALRQGVRLSGLASSWAALLVHAGAFLKPEGRIAMVLPAELLTVGYAEPVRRWLRRRFADVNLVLFERLQFAEALEDVVLLLAQGSGGCDAFKLFRVSDAHDLKKIKAFDGLAASVSEEGKWTDLLLTLRQRQVFKGVAEKGFVRLGEYGSPELGTVTGANAFFTIRESTRRRYELREGKDVVRISPPGTRHLRGLTFSAGDWQQLREQEEPVWILYPKADTPSKALQRYLVVGEAQGVPGAYKCTVRKPWWRPPVVSSPDLFFTYMSHRYPRLIQNCAGVTFVNSMHGVRLKESVPDAAAAALPLLALNSMTMLGAEINGRSYGGGILKIEPREAAKLPVPDTDTLQEAWSALDRESPRLDEALRSGRWVQVVERIDQVLLGDALRHSAEDISLVQSALHTLRSRRLARGDRAG
jgi:adenine-specific DNA-methyltransferase